MLIDVVVGDVFVEKVAIWLGTYLIDDHDRFVVLYKGEFFHTEILTSTVNSLHCFQNNFFNTSLPQRVGIDELRKQQMVGIDELSGSSS